MKISHKCIHKIVKKQKFPDEEVSEAMVQFREALSQIGVELGEFELVWSTTTVKPKSVLQEDGEYKDILYTFQHYYIKVLERNVYIISVWVDSNRMVDNTEIICVKKIKDDSELVKNCHLKEFPFQFDLLSDSSKSTQTNTMEYKDDVMFLNDKELEIIELYNSPNKSHQPFYKNRSGIDIRNSDRIVRYPQCDIDGLYAVIVNRFAWGMNVAAGFIDVCSGRMYLWISNNYDYPAGIALKLHPDDGVLICTSNGYVSEEELYVTETPEFVGCNAGLKPVHDHERWITFAAETYFTTMYQWLKFKDTTPCKTYVEFYNYKYLDNLLSEAKFDDAISFIKTVEEWFTTLGRYVVTNHIGNERIISMHNTLCVCSKFLYNLDIRDTSVELFYRYKDEWMKNTQLHHDDDLIPLAEFIPELDDLLLEEIDSDEDEEENDEKRHQMFVSQVNSILRSMGCSSDGEEDPDIKKDD